VLKHRRLGFDKEIGRVVFVEMAAPETP